MSEWSPQGKLYEDKEQTKIITITMIGQARTNSKDTLKANGIKCFRGNELKCCANPTSSVVQPRDEEFIFIKYWRSFQTLPQRIHIIVVINSICFEEQLHCSVGLQQEHNA